jgi:hypothetical protein
MRHFPHKNGTTEPQSWSNHKHGSKKGNPSMTFYEEKTTEKTHGARLKPEKGWSQQVPCFGPQCLQRSVCDLRDVLEMVVLSGISIPNTLIYGDWIMIYSGSIGRNGVSMRIYLW